MTSKGGAAAKRWRRLVVHGLVSEEATPSLPPSPGPECICASAA